MRGIEKYIAPNITMLTKPYMPRCAWATVKWVKCVTVLTARSASNEPWAELSVYIMPPRTMKRSVGERSEEHTSELQSLMRISYAVFCWKNTHTRCCC